MTSKTLSGVADVQTANPLKLFRRWLFNGHAQRSEEIVRKVALNAALAHQKNAEVRGEIGAIKDCRDPLATLIRNMKSYR